MALDMARPVLGIVLVGSVQVAVGAALQKQQEPRVKRSFPGSLAYAAWAGSASAPARPIVLGCRLAREQTERAQERRGADHYPRPAPGGTGQVWHR